MRIPELQRIVIEGAREQERREQGHNRLISGRRPLIALIAVLAIGGSSAAAVLSLRDSRPLSGTLPAPLLDLHASGETRYRLSVFPFLSVGWTGWCSAATFTVHARIQATSYGCGPVERANQIQFYDDEFGDQSGDYMDEIVSDRVTEVRYGDGVEIEPISDPRLPRGMRAAVRVLSSREAAKASGGRLFIGSELLDADGHQLFEPPTSSDEAVEHLPLTTLAPSNPGDLPCAIHAVSTPGLVPVSETVARPVPWPRRAPGGFLACANAVYRLDGTNLAAAALANALDPNKPAERLPGLTSDPSYPGILQGQELGSIGYPEGSGVGSFDPSTRPFYDPGRHQWDLTEEHNARDHDISATRAGKGWLIVEGGTLEQRSQLLAVLHTNP
jgi:hypothetical protein